MTNQRNLIQRRGVTLTVLRPETEVVAYGFGSEALGTPFEIRAVWQPNTPKRMQHDMDGQRGRDTWAVWSLQEIQNDDQIDDPDTGDTYVLQQVEYWAFGNFWRGLTMRRAYKINTAETAA